MAALRAARKAAARGPVRIYATEIDATAAESDGASLIRLMPVSAAVDDEKGRNIRARVEELSTAVAFRASADDGHREWLPRAQFAWRAEWRRILAAHHYEVCAPLVEFLTSIERRYAIGEVDVPDEIVVDVGRHPGADAVCQHAKALLRLPAPVVLLRSSSAVRRAAFAEVSRQIRRVVRIQVKRLLGRGSHRGTPEVNIDAGGEGVVLVQYEPGMMKRLPLGATQDWIEASRLPPRRIVYYFNRVDSPLDDPIKTELARRGFGWADYREPADHVHDPDGMFIRNARQILGASRSVRSRAGITRWLLFAQILPQVERHREFLRFHRVVGLHQHGEFLPGQMALNLACRQEAVAFVWGFWSALVFLSGWYQHAFSDLVLAWGGYDVGHDNALSFDYRYAVECGVLGYDGREPNDLENATSLRQRLAARPRFVVTLFDSSHDERSIHQSTANCALFYRIVLALVRENPDWGCLIKSKGDNYDLLPVQSGLQDVVAELEAEGRCLRLPHETKPTLVALAGDAVACFSINSAGIQAALGSGRPTLHFDPNNLKMHPLSVAGGDGKIIFRDAADFSLALRAIAAGSRTIGDLSPWAHLFDSFGDGMGRKRSGEVMHDYVAARDRGLGLDAALREAVEAHAARYGSARAATRQMKQLGAGSKLWRQVQRLHYPGWPDDLPFSEGGRLSEIALSGHDGAGEADAADVKAEVL